MSLKMPVGEFGEIIHERVVGYGGYRDYHTHLDRAGMLSPSALPDPGVNPLDVARKPLRAKQNIVGEVHRGAEYTRDRLHARMDAYLDRAKSTGTNTVVSFIDATPDVGSMPVEVAIELRKKYGSQEMIDAGRSLDFQIAAHPIFGFKKDPQLDETITRWDLFQKICANPEVSIIGGLPERDDKPDSVGSDEHFRRVLKLGHDFGKPVHIHVGQANIPSEKNIFDLIEAVRWIGAPVIPKYTNIGEPTVWAIHDISSTAFNESEHRKKLEGLKKYNIGIIVCSRAAISMRQRRAIYAPTHNSIARVPELLVSEISVRLGNDNIADMFVPTGSGCMLHEVLFLADCIRMYDPEVLAKLASGTSLNQNDIETVRQYLLQDEKAHVADDPNFEFCIDLD